MNRHSVLVTGATGFIGRHLVAHCLTQGWQTIAVVRTPERARVLPQQPRLVLTQAGDSEDLRGILDEYRPDAVIHLATHFVARHVSAEDVSAMIRANVGFGSDLAQAAAGVGTPMVTASSVWQHYRGAGYDPVSLYAATKQALDDILRYYSTVEGLGWTRMILGDTYGPGDDRNKLLTHLLNAAVSQRPLPAGSGQQLWSAVHVHDVVRALLGAAEEQAQEAIFREYQIRATPSPTVREVVATAEEAIGRPVPVEWNARPDRGREMLQPWIVADAPPLWSAEIGLPEGIREVWNSDFAPPGTADPQHEPQIRG